MRLKTSVVFYGLVALVPIGVAVAEVTGEPANSAAHAEADRLTGGLFSVGERLANNIRGARSHTAEAARKAQADGDILLATCLEHSLAKLQHLEQQAGMQVDLLSEAANPEAAQLPNIRLGTLDREAALVAKQASACVGADGQTTLMVSTPTDLNAGPKGDLELSGGSSVPIVPPPRTRSITSTDFVMDMPSMPTVASPVR